MEKIIKIVPPNRLITAPYGTIHTIEVEGGTGQYIQISNDEEKPEWKTMGDFLMIAFTEQLEKKLFIDQCLLMYKLQMEKPVSSERSESRETPVQE